MSADFRSLCKLSSSEFSEGEEHTSILSLLFFFFFFVPSPSFWLACDSRTNGNMYEGMKYLPLKCAGFKI